MKSLFALSLLLVSSAAEATTVTVQSTDSVYNYDGSATAGPSSTTPPLINLASGTSYLTFSATGLVSLTPLAEPYGPHGPDGGPNSFSMNVSAANSLSGVSSPNVGYLAGVFLNGAEGSALPPATLNYSSAGTGETFATLSPLVDQVFYIGDGLTGTGSGSPQQFFVPFGATELVLGIVDAGNYNGPPGAYFDNSGSYQVTVTPNITLPTSPAGAAPEPATWGLMVTGFGIIGVAMRRRRKSKSTSMRPHQI